MFKFLKNKSKNIQIPPLKDVVYKIETEYKPKEYERQLRKLKRVVAQELEFVCTLTRFPLTFYINDEIARINYPPLLGFVDQLRSLGYNAEIRVDEWDCPAGSKTYCLIISLPK